MTARITDGKAAKKVQSTLAIPHTHVTRTCTQCGMTYNPLLAADVGVHAKYHDNFTNGISWPPMLQSPQHAAETVFVTLKRKTTKRGSLKSIVTREGKSATIQIVDKLSSKQVDKVETMMAMVNSELNAVDDSKQWRSAQFESSKAFVLVIDNRAVGLCTTDTIQHGEWLIHKTQSLVPNRKISSCRVGISRIWIAPKWRQNGLAASLVLEADYLPNPSMACGTRVGRY
ncbi:uncharacterized protein LODBEIA_P02540 [Lodderomyces beijingensis]|uniref:N-acetyltransferase ESCO zinc-finger domain-containing protein n=1 Tax=Lodderomyces beijingensis TaxID=1775926 RepID=A0ABP0ZI65_9ASCO